jgi:hypothetical protein
MPAWYDITSLEEGDENREDRQGWNTDPQNCFHIRTRVADQLHFGTDPDPDPDPVIFVSDLQDDN